MLKITLKLNLLTRVLTLVLTLVCFVIFFSSNLFAREQTVGSLKAAYVYNVAKFTRWPESVWRTKDSPFKLCLYGEGDTISQLKLLANRSMHGHSILVETVTTNTSINDCHVLYISESENRRYGYLLSLIKQQTTLTISSDSRFLRLGGLINLTEIDQRLQFEVNMEQLAHSKLTLSSKLLKLGKLIDKPR